MLQRHHLRAHPQKPRRQNHSRQGRVHIFRLPAPACALATDAQRQVLVFFSTAELASRSESNSSSCTFPSASALASGGLSNRIMGDFVPEHETYSRDSGRCLRLLSSCLTMGINYLNRIVVDSVVPFCLGGELSQSLLISEPLLYPMLPRDLYARKEVTLSYRPTSPPSACRLGRLCSQSLQRKAG